jgi:site-specific DNA-methyltransferase (adenine-specific)
VSGIFYCGDNLEILGELGLVPAGSVDLIYLDPPFNSQRTYNVVYKNSQAQELAFKDYWSWDEAAPTFARFIESTEVPERLRTMLRGLHDLLIEDDADLLAYIAMMSPRLVALHSVLKTHGSFYLHCDPTASHYLKVILDSLFGVQRFKNEIIWKRKAGRGETNNTAVRFGVSHDVILFYVKGKDSYFSAQTRPNNPQYIASKFTHDDGDGRIYRLDNLTSPSPRPNLCYEYKGYQPPRNGWAVSLERMKEMDREGRVWFPADKTKRLQRKRYLDELEGETVDTLWDDIAPINSQAAERLGYPTQKPLALLERIIAASSKRGDLVLDPFCGCGTTIEACETMGRRWIGIDIARKAVEVTEERFQKLGREAPEVEWFPPDLDAAEALAKRSGIKFEEWARFKLRAVRNRKRDRGIDGEALFQDQSGRKTHVLISVKGGGKLSPAMVRELRGTIEREKAPIGVLVTMHEPSKEMRREATLAGFISGAGGEQFPKLQILTMKQVFDGEGIRAPGANVTVMPPPRVPGGLPKDEQLALGFDAAKQKPHRPKTKPLVKVRPDNENGTSKATPQRRTGRPAE